MPTSDPVTAALAALATGAILGLLGALYREHREPFLFWAVVAWAATLLHFVAELPRELDDEQLSWTFVAAVALVLRRGRRDDSRDRLSIALDHEGVAAVARRSSRVRWRDGGPAATLP